MQLKKKGSKLLYIFKNHVAKVIPWRKLRTSRQNSEYLKRNGPLTIEQLLIHWMPWDGFPVNCCSSKIYKYLETQGNKCQFSLHCVFLYVRRCFYTSIEHVDILKEIFTASNPKLEGDSKKNVCKLYWKITGTDLRLIYTALCKFYNITISVGVCYTKNHQLSKVP